MDLENWMGCIKEEIKDKKLSEIVIPGSHDSGSYCINRKSKYDSLRYFTVDFTDSYQVSATLFGSL